MVKKLFFICVLLLSSLNSQKLFAWGPTYEIYRNDLLYAVVKKQLFSLFNCRFSIDVPGPNDIEAKGDFLNHEYHFTCKRKSIATVSKKWFTLTDTYGVDIYKEQDDVFILACTVVIDLARQDNKKKRH